MTRKTEYREWSIDAAPIMHYKMFRACAIIERKSIDGDEPDERFMFSDLGDYETRADAEVRGTAWAQHWIDVNFGY